MSNLVKQFGQLRAVDCVSLTLYERQIFCLLGHNGAGKSTTISLLTGLLTPEQGTITIDGMNYMRNLDEIRKVTGLCLQQNVLYDDLTVEEHLKYYSDIKGTPRSQVELEVNQIIAKCALGDEIGKYSRDLSGGNKRKLSLANALVGGSKVVFLDEPSSGLDPNSRQAIWNILREVRAENRTIVLTTHHLEEAEHLSQRIAIMAKGKLIVVGDRDYIKTKFGVGYHLGITIQTPEMKQKVMDLVESVMPGVKLDEQSAHNVLRFILPLSRQNEFSRLFERLEQ